VEQIVMEKIADEVQKKAEEITQADDASEKKDEVL
jgi:hypothetical protein